MIHISIRCDFCDEYYGGDGWVIFCLPGDILRAYSELKKEIIKDGWLYSSSNRRWYCPHCREKRIEKKKRC